MKPNWKTKRQEPYTVRGIAKLECIRCGAQAVHQWQICSDGNNYRPICLACDVALNELVLRWFRHPDAAPLLAAYRGKVSPK